jgi:hypothetical protein
MLVYARTLDHLSKAPVPSHEKVAEAFAAYPSIFNYAFVAMSYWGNMFNMMHPEHKLFTSILLTDKYLGYIYWYYFSKFLIPAFRKGTLVNVTGIDANNVGRLETMANNYIRFVTVEYNDNSKFNTIKDMFHGAPEEVEGETDDLPDELPVAETPNKRTSAVGTLNLGSPSERRGSVIPKKKRNRTSSSSNTD